MKRTDKVHLSVPRGSVVMDKDDITQIAIERLESINNRSSFQFPDWVMEHLIDVIASTIARYSDLSIQMPSPYILVDNLLINCASYGKRIELFGTEDLNEIQKKVQEAEFKGEREVVFTHEDEPENILLVYLSHIDDH